MERDLGLETETYIVERLGLERVSANLLSPGQKWRTVLGLLGLAVKLDLKPKNGLILHHKCDWTK